MVVLHFEGFRSVHQNWSLLSQSKVLKSNSSNSHGHTMSDSEPPPGNLLRHAGGGALKTNFSI